MNDTLLSRIRTVFEESGLTQAAIGKKLNVSPQYIWKLLNNDNSRPRENIIKAICREFLINENWLRTGEGDSHLPKDDKLASYLSAISNGNDKFIKSLIVTYMELDQPSKNLLENFVVSISKKIQAD